MYRFIEIDLKKWKSYSKMLLMLVGARQVDKTYVLENFCKENYEKKYINLDKEENISQIYNPKYSIRILDLIIILNQFHCMQCFVLINN